jgi:hypothetical protein
MGVFTGSGSLMQLLLSHTYTQYGPQSFAEWQQKAGRDLLPARLEPPVKGF